MSYCRFSSDDFQSDVYVYEEAGGSWKVHVAQNRPVYTEPLPEPVEIREDNISAWLFRHHKVMEMLKTAERVNIEGPYTGQSFALDTPGECAELLANIRDAGYVVPQKAIDRLLEEENERVKSGDD